MAAEKKVRYITPAGLARFPKLDVPVTFKNPKTGKEGDPKFECGWLPLSDKDLAKVEADFRKIMTGFGLDEDIKTPIKKDKKDKTIKFFNAHSSAKYKPPIFDSRNKKINVAVGGGSTIRLDLSVVPYDGFGGGITCYINAVQVLDLKAPGGFDGPQFEEVEDGFVGGDENESPFAGADGEDMHDF